MDGPNAANRPQQLVFTNEFQQLCAKGAEELAPMVQEYPLTSAIMMVACLVLGISNFFSLHLPTTAVLVTIGGFVAMAVKYDSAAFQKEFMRSFWEVFEVAKGFVKTKAANSAPQVSVSSSSSDGNNPRVDV